MTAVVETAELKMWLAARTDIAIDACRGHRVHASSKGRAD